MAEGQSYSPSAPFEDEGVYEFDQNILTDSSANFAVDGEEEEEEEEEEDLLIPPLLPTTIEFLEHPFESLFFVVCLIAIVTLMLWSIFLHNNERTLMFYYLPFGIAFGHEIWSLLWFTKDVYQQFLRTRFTSLLVGTVLLLFVVMTGIHSTRELCSHMTSHAHFCSTCSSFYMIVGLLIFAWMVSCLVALAVSLVYLIPLAILGLSQLILDHLCGHDRVDRENRSEIRSFLFPPVLLSCAIAGMALYCGVIYVLSLTVFLNCSNDFYFY